MYTVVSQTAVRAYFVPGPFTSTGLSEYLAATNPLEKLLMNPSLYSAITEPEREVLYAAALPLDV